MEWFRNRIEAKVVIEQWRQQYNAVRPHLSLGYKTPLEFKADWMKNDKDGDDFSGPLLKRVSYMPLNQYLPRKLTSPNKQDDRDSSVYTNRPDIKCLS